MKTRTTCIVALAAALLTGALAPALAATPASTPTRASKARGPDRFPIHAVELAFEVSPAQLSLPDAGASFMLVQPCAKCASQSLAIDARSQFFLNDVSLPLAELRRRLGNRSNWSATALYTPGELRLTRLLVVSP